MSSTLLSDREFIIIESYKTTRRMATADGQDQLGQVLINFSTNAAFPEEESVSAAYVQKSALAPALAALATARSELEVQFSQ